MNMKNGEKKMSRFKTVHPLMVYMPLGQRARVKIYAKKGLMPVSQVVREGIEMRMAIGDRYTSGWNDALIEVAKVIKECPAGQMKFPSGRSFSDMLCDDVTNLSRKNK